MLTDCADGAVKFATASHTAGPDHQGGGSWKEEKVILEHYRAVRQAVEAAEGIDTQVDDTTPEMVAAAIKSLGPPSTDEPSKAEVDLLVRAFRRGKVSGPRAGFTGTAAR